MTKTEAAELIDHVIRQIKLTREEHQRLSYAIAVLLKEEKGTDVKLDGVEK